MTPTRVQYAQTVAATTSAGRSFILPSTLLNPWGQVEFWATAHLARENEFSDRAIVASRRRRASIRWTPCRPATRADGATSRRSRMHPSPGVRRRLPESDPPRCPSPLHPPSRACSDGRPRAPRRLFRASFAAGQPAGPRFDRPVRRPVRRQYLRHPGRRRRLQVQARRLAREVRRDAARALRPPPLRGQAQGAPAGLRRLARQPASPDLVRPREAGGADAGDLAAAADDAERAGGARPASRRRCCRTKSSATSTIPSRRRTCSTRSASARAASIRTRGCGAR